ncbi:unnamed protein product [Merluccius merluccius]
MLSVARRFGRFWRFWLGFQGQLRLRDPPEPSLEACAPAGLADRPGPRTLGRLHLVDGKQRSYAENDPWPGAAARRR